MWEHKLKNLLIYLIKDDQWKDKVVFVRKKYTNPKLEKYFRNIRTTLVIEVLIKRITFSALPYQTTYYVNPCDFVSSFLPLHQIYNLETLFLFLL